MAMAMVMASESSGSASSAGSGVGSNPLCPAGTHPKGHALLSSWIQRLRPVPPPTYAPFDRIQTAAAFLEEPASPSVGSGKLRVRTQNPKDGSAGNSSSGSESVGSQIGARESNHMAASLEAVPDYEKFSLRSPNHIECNPPGQLGVTWLGCTHQSEAYGQPHLEFASGVERSPCSPCGELSEATPNFTPPGQTCSRFNHLPMPGRAPLSEESPPLASACLPCHRTLAIESVLKPLQEAPSCGANNTHPQNPFAILPIDCSRPKQAEEPAPQGYTTNVICQVSHGKNQVHTCGLEEATPDQTPGIRSPHSHHSGDFPIKAHRTKLEKKVAFAKPLKSENQILGSDKQGIDQAYVLTPIFSQSHSFLRSKADQIFTEVVHKERVVALPLPLPLIRPFPPARSAKTIRKNRTQNSASSGSYSNHKDSGPSNGLGSKLTSVKSAQRPLTQRTSDSVTASLSKEFVSDQYKKAFSFDEDQYSEDSCPCKDEGKT